MKASASGQTAQLHFRMSPKAAGSSFQTSTRAFLDQGCLSPQPAVGSNSGLSTVATLPFGNGARGDVGV